MSKRQTIEPHEGDERYVRRDERGHFTDDQTSVGDSLAQDRRHRARHEAPRGEGDRGDRK